MEATKLEEAWRPKPGVVNMNMIQEAINRMMEDEVPGNVIDEDEGYKLQEITHLFLEHLDIFRIDHLWVLPALTVLKLTGNNLQKIENLDTLVHLVDLNLSFNRIEVIENLDKLTKLRHLSLFSNQITQISNIGHLTNLKIFTVLQLRKLNLFSLNMADNPCAQEEGFRTFVAAYLPNLEFYEYKKVTPEERNEGRETNLRDLELLEREEAKELKEADLAKVEEDKETLYTRAFVEGLDKDQLYEAMVSADPSAQGMLLIGDEIQDIFRTFQEEIGKVTTDIFELGLEQLKLRDSEVAMFQEGTQDAILKGRAKQRLILEKFLGRKQDMVVEMDDLWEVLAKQASDDSMRRSIEEKVDKANILCHAVKRELLGLELTLSEQLKEVFALFERNLGDMVNSFIETTQGFFTLMREHETVFSEQLGDLAGRYLTQLTIRNEDLSNLPPLLRSIVADKEAVNQAVASSHDTHLQIIDNREDQLMSRIRTWYTKLCSDYEEEETARFRGRISEIVTFLEMQTRDFEQFHVTIDDEMGLLMMSDNL